MTLFPFYLQWKNKPQVRQDILDQAYIQGYSNGFESGLKMASEVDKIALKNIKDSTIDQTLRRLNGSN